MSKKISSETIENIIKANKKEDKTLVLRTADAEIKVVIKPYISYQERTQMVHNIADYCYDEIGKYHPEFFDNAYKMMLIEYYTNINTNIEDSVNQMHILSKTTDIIDKIEETIGNEASDIYCDAKAIITWRNEQSLKSNAWDDVAYMISGLLDKLADRLDKMPETSKEDADKFAALTAKLGNMTEDKIIDGILKFHNKDN